MNEYDNINLAGEKCVSIALGKGLIKDKNVIMIDSLKHAIVFKV